MGMGGSLIILSPTAPATPSGGGKGSMALLPVVPSSVTS